MKMVQRILAGGLAVVLAVGPMVSNADWIGDFYTAAGAGSNLTPGTSIATQNVVGYAGGGLTWRVPNRNLQPFAIRPPSLKAGCGGIDLYLGAFSFPNKDAFVNALRNFGQASIGYFFELALATMAPEIKVTLDHIGDLANEMNQFSINSCAAAKAMVDSVGPTLLKGFSRDATGSTRAAGTYNDDVDATLAIGNDGAKILAEKYKANYGTTESAVTTSTVATRNPVKMNVLYWALRNGNDDIDLTSDPLASDEIDLMISLIGPSAIIDDQTAADGTVTLGATGKPHTLEFKDLVGENAMVTTGPFLMPMLTCGSDAQCLNPTPIKKAVNPFSVRVASAITAIQNAVDSRTKFSLTAEQAAVVKLTSVPLYRAAALSRTAGVGGVVGGQMVIDLADYAALDAAYRFVEHYLRTAEKMLSTAGSKLPKEVDQSEVKKIVDRIQVIKGDMRQQVAEFYKNKGNPYEKLNQLDKIEREMYGNLNVMLAANARFGKR